MPKTVVTVVLVATATTLVNRVFAKRQRNDLLSALIEEGKIQVTLAYNHGFGDGHRLGVENERHHALVRATLPSMN